MFCGISAERTSWDPTSRSRGSSRWPSVRRVARRSGRRPGGARPGRPTYVDAEDDFGTPSTSADGHGDGARRRRVHAVRWRRDPDRGGLGAAVPRAGSTRSARAHRHRDPADAGTRGRRSHGRWRSSVLARARRTGRLGRAARRTRRLGRRCWPASEDDGGAALGTGRRPGRAGSRARPATCGRGRAGNALGAGLAGGRPCGLDRRTGTPSPAVAPALGDAVAAHVDVAVRRAAGRGSTGRQPEDRRRPRRGSAMSRSTGARRGRSSGPWTGGPWCSPAALAGNEPPSPSRPSPCRAPTSRCSSTASDWSTPGRLRGPGDGRETSKWLLAAHRDPLAELLRSRGYRRRGRCRATPRSWLDMDGTWDDRRRPRPRLRRDGRSGARARRAGARSPERRAVTAGDGGLRPHARALGEPAAESPQTDRARRVDGYGSSMPRGSAGHRGRCRVRASACRAERPVVRRTAHPPCHPFGDKSSKSDYGE